MVHRTSEDNHYSDEAPYTRGFPSSISRKNSSVGSNYGYYQDELFIYYRPPDKDYFEGPFSEIQCQFWYKQGFFFNVLEFKFGPDGRIETLESLKERNGRECPFQEGSGKSAPSSDLSSTSEFMVKTCMNRVITLAEELEQLKEDREKLKIQRKIEIDALTNRVKELMEKDTRNEKTRRETERKMTEMQVDIADLTESLASTAVSTESVVGETTNELETAFCEHRSISEKTAVDVSICEDLTELRNELERLQNSVHSLDQFTFKLSHKVEKLKCKYKVVDIIGEGLNSKDGVFDRLAYLESSMDEIQAVIASMEGKKMERGEEKKEETEDDGQEKREKEEEEQIVLPVERPNGEDFRSEGSIPDVWHSPNDKFSPSTSDHTLTATSFAAASESIAAVATAAWPAPEKIVEVGEPSDVDNWESIDEEEGIPWSEDMMKRDEMVTPLPQEDTVDMVTGDVDKENLEVKIDGGAGHLELLGNGLGLLLQSLEAGSEDSATDADIDRLVTAIKGAKLLQIAESLKQHFGKALICDVCSTDEKKELRNAIEYFEHLNRTHFKKCGGGDRMLVNQFAYLLEQFKASIPVPIALAKRQYAEREKNKPWLKKEETRKTPGRKKK